MKVATFQFAVSSDVSKNLEIIERAIIQAEKNGVELLVFPECALTGYPPRDIKSSSEVDFDLVHESCVRLKETCDKSGVAFILGMIAKENGQIFNRAVFFAPGEKCKIYEKRALWGWDRDNFVAGKDAGIVDYKGFRIGIRICFEVRFPEYFRELYKAGADLAVVLFYDVSDTDDMERYNLIKGHLQTRAVENVFTVISANSISPFQTAPSAIIGRSGQILQECNRNEQCFAEYDLQEQEYDFGERGRKEITDELLTNQRSV